MDGILLLNILADINIEKIDFTSVLQHLVNNKISIKCIPTNKYGKIQSPQVAAQNSNNYLKIDYNFLESFTASVQIESKISDTINKIKFEIKKDASKVTEIDIEISNFFKTEFAKK